jgi:hypothetical protein
MTVPMSRRDTRQAFVVLLSGQKAARFISRLPGRRPGCRQNPGNKKAGVAAGFDVSFLKSALT